MDAIKEVKTLVSRLIDQKAMDIEDNGWQDGTGFKRRQGEKVLDVVISTIVPNMTYHLTAAMHSDKAGLFPPTIHMQGASAEMVMDFIKRATSEDLGSFDIKAARKELLAKFTTPASPSL